MRFIKKFRLFIKNIYSYYFKRHYFEVYNEYNIVCIENYIKRYELDDTVEYHRIKIEKYGKIINVIYYFKYLR